MGILMINCPSTGRVVSTGIELSGVDQLPTVIATIQCSVCGCVHEWTKHNAWLAEDGEQEAARARPRGQPQRRKGIRGGKHDSRR